LKSCLLVNLKVFQHLGYFPNYDEIPACILTQVQKITGARRNVAPRYPNPVMLYKHRDLIRDYLQILPWGRGTALHVALEKAVELAAVMDNPVDLINAAIETLIRERCELPPFETLDRLVRRATDS
jgi:hypothetical protein